MFIKLLTFLQWKKHKINSEENVAGIQDGLEMRNNRIIVLKWYRNFMVKMILNSGFMLSLFFVLLCLGVGGSLKKTPCCATLEMLEL